uniref:Gelsolin-like domain-containing protein n=1 Tax=Plectus sambesii TaxID=2011161 RepID=A0A914VTA8_9BILA
MVHIDPAFVGAGQTIGLEIWRVKNFEVQPVDKSQYGNFYSGDSYIVLNSKPRKEWDVHFWLGKETTQDEMGTAAIKTVELDDALGGGPVQYREVQDHESALFLSYFKNGIKYLQGGYETGFAHVEDYYANWKPRLFHCKGKRNVRCSQVNCKREELNTGDVFILDLGLDIYVWMPPESGRLERIKGMEQAKSMRDKERAGRPTIHVLDADWKNCYDFWKYLGGKENGVGDIKHATAAGADENYWHNHREQATLWKVSDATGKMVVSKLSQGNLTMEMLDSKDAFMLDAVNGGLYVWVGRDCTADERKKAMVWAQRYLEQQGRPKWSQVVRVLEGAEPDDFTQWFSTWSGDKKKSSFHPKLYQCSDESGKLIIEEISNYTQEDLDGDDVMILDAGAIVYVWVGISANKGEKDAARSRAEKYLSTDTIPRPKGAAVETVFQSEESPTFKKFFPSWNEALFKNQQRSAENMRKLLFS